MGLADEWKDGQTPLSDEEKEGLLLSTIATHGELNEFEQHQIEQAMQWLMMRSLKPSTIFTATFICNLHKRMYAGIWLWAGNFRKTNKNIGIDKWQIGVELKQLLDDAMFWHQNNSYPPDEIAIRFKHRLVSIHCFPNGNGRHSRLMADVIIEKIYGLPVFSWGAANLSNESDTRKAYLRAVKAADMGDYSALLSFARS